jgi:hypothetical protein
MAQSEAVMCYRARARELAQEATHYTSAELRELAHRVVDAYERLADRLEVLSYR